MNQNSIKKGNNLKRITVGQKIEIEKRSWGGQNNTIDKRLSPEKMYEHLSDNPQRANIHPEIYKSTQQLYFPLMQAADAVFNQRESI